MYKYDVKAKEPQKYIKRNVLVQSLQQSLIQKSLCEIPPFMLHRANQFV